MRGWKAGSRGTLASLACLLAGCVYFNAMYDARNEYDRGLQELRRGSTGAARVAFDSVIAKTGRITENHPDSKYADDAALLKTRSELHNELWESARSSAELAIGLADDSVSAYTAAGLLGVAEYRLGELERADSLLTAAAGGPVGEEDRALFLFNRGQARLRLGRAEEAAADLEAVSRQGQLSEEAALDLAIALTRIGRYGEATALVTDLLRRNRYGDLGPALQAEVDTLIRRAPAVMDSALDGLLVRPRLQSTKTATLFFLRAMARVNADDPEAALLYLDSAVAASPNSRYTGDAAYFAARLRLDGARDPSVVELAIPDLQRAATRASNALRRRQAARLLYWAQRFVPLADAVESRGATAAEAALRAAEIAGTELGAPALARGFYLKYVELAPDSRWTAKAISGAFAYSGHAAGSWVDDQGPETDRSLRTLLAGLSERDPYRLALLPGAARTPVADSLYVRAERELRDRIEAIQAAFDPDAAAAVPGRALPVAASDTAAADSAANAVSIGEEEP